MKILLLSLSLLLLVPNFIHVSLELTPVYDKIEQFDPSLSYITTVDELIHVSDSTAKAQNIIENSLEYAVTVVSIIRNRFYHGFSNYPLNENWIAAICQHSFGYGLGSIVTPDDILKYSYGGCSQQTLVLFEVMKKKHIPYRSVGFPHHFACELTFNNKWYFFDPNMEPNILDSERVESNWNGSVDSLKKYYDRKHFPDLDWKFGKDLHVSYGTINAKPAPNAKMFQTVTKYLSKIIWILPACVAFRRRKVKSELRIK